MIEAIVHGKLSRDQENMEDILTSNVFGLLKHVPTPHGLLPFLAHAETLNGERFITDPAQDVQVNFKFWPWMEEAGCVRCQPDVLLSMSWPTGRQCLVLVESKYRCGKSSEEDWEIEASNDQLGKEWENLEKVAAQRSMEPILIFLTAHLSAPTADIVESARKHVTFGRTFKCYWLSWRHLSNIPVSHPLLHDLHRLLDRLNLIFFAGIRLFRARPIRSWMFARPLFAFDRPQDLRWRFGHEYNFADKRYVLNWRFR